MVFITQFEVIIMVLKVRIAVMLAASLMLVLVSANSQAASAGDWILRVGVSDVSPYDSSGDLSAAPGGQVAVDGDTQPSFTITYMLSDQLGLEVLASLPFRHDISGAGNLAGAGKIADVSLELLGKGPIGKRQKPGFLTKLFNKIF